jgi:hypothetical protein
VAPFSTYGNSINLNFIQYNSFKFGKALDEVSEFGSFLINLHLVMCKVDNILRVFNGGRLSKEGINPMVSTFSCENDVIHDGTLLISSQSCTWKSSRCTIAFIAFGKISKFLKDEMWNVFNFTNIDSWRGNSKISSQLFPLIWSFGRLTNSQMSYKDVWSHSFQHFVSWVCLPHNPSHPFRLRYWSDVRSCTIEGRYLKL